METIDLSKFEPQETLNHTSKGNQLKWKCDGYWYKADHMGYEGLAETIVSALLAKSTVKYWYDLYRTRKSLLENKGEMFIRKVREFYKAATKNHYPM